MSFKNVPTYSYQRIFDIVWKGAKKQNFRKSENFARCMYRSNARTRCHIGHLIDDSEYRTSLEGRPVQEVAELLGVGLSSQKREFLSFLQYHCHDKCKDASEIKRQLKAFAKNRGLTIQKG